MMDSAPLTMSSLRAATDEVLTSAGFCQIPDPPDWGNDYGGVYEDPYSIVGLAIFETWAALATQWLDLQVALAQLISENFAGSEPKAWEGYLVLLTPSIVPDSAQQDANDIRRNTQHLRKLLGTGDDIAAIGQVERLLFPLLPLHVVNAEAGSGDALALLPQILGEQGIDPDAVRVAIEAFTAQQPIVERLHEHLRSEAGCD